MRKWLLIILALVCSTVNAQFNRDFFRELLSTNTVTPPPTLKSFTVPVIPITDNDIVGYGRGANSFYGGQAVQVPINGQNTPALDDDTRFTWAELQPTSAGVYVWTDIDNAIKACIDLNKQFSFGIVTVCTDCTLGNPTIGPAKASYPVFVHNAMQAEAIKDWNYTAAPEWIPNWNSPSYINNFHTFLHDLAQHFATTSYKGIVFKNVIYKQDIRGYGNWGEWHTFPWVNCGCVPAGTSATDATLEAIIDMYALEFPNIPLIGNINMLVDNAASLAFGYYFLTHSNAFGPFGIRSDHLAEINTVNFDTIVLASRTFNGLNFKTAYYTRYLTSPMNGEPINDAAGSAVGCGFSYCDLDHEVRNWHLSQFSNVSSNTTDANSVAMFRTASKSAGYRVQISNGSVSNNFASGTNMQLNLTWANVGYAPIYQFWNVQIDLRNAGGGVVWTGQSTFVPRLFMTNTNSTDNFSTPVLPPGTYSVSITVIDPLAYRSPFGLYNTGRRADGSYLLTTITIV